MGGSRCGHGGDSKQHGPPTPTCVRGSSFQEYATVWAHQVIWDSGVVGMSWEPMHWWATSSTRSLFTDSDRAWLWCLLLDGVRVAHSVALAGLERARLESALAPVRPMGEHRMHSDKRGTSAQPRSQPPVRQVATIGRKRVAGAAVVGRHELHIDEPRTIRIPPNQVSSAWRAAPTRPPVGHTSGPRSRARGTSERDGGLPCGGAPRCTLAAPSREIAACLIEHVVHWHNATPLVTRWR